VARFIDELKRTHYCGELREANIDQEVVLFGWVDGRRDHGGCIFIDLRDRDGLTQVVFDPAVEKAPFETGDRARPEWVLGIRGRVRDRGDMRNDRMPTGAIEVVALEVTDQTDTGEDKRLQHRYLDLRRPSLQRALRIRHQLNHSARNYLSENGFLEIETPFMVKYTPGGARNFLVPSRIHPGSFYALAESPQLYKQLLMVGGFDRYFQIVRCFRDEALRLDRQPEFTQIDIEMSFINQDDLFGALEGLVFRLWKEALGVDLKELYPDGTFPRLGFDESMRKYGNDKPDLRFGLEHTDLTELVVEHGGGGVPLLEPIAKRFTSGEDRLDLPAQIVKALVVPASAGLSRTEVDKLEQFVKSMGSKGLARAKVADDGTWTQSPFGKNATPEFRAAVNEATGASPGDIILFQLGPEARVQTVMANLRIHLGKRLGLIPESGTGGHWNFLWVVNPPLFEWDEESGRWAAAHHMFTRPHDECVELLEKDPGKVLCYRYDLVLNGFEIAGGSIRLHDPDVQRRVFDVVGLGEEEARDKFGFLLDALQYGAPPHGGIAFGMDRVAMLATETESIRDVIAFPKTQRGFEPLSGAPGRVSPEQLADLKIRTLE
jgi:aspartyl-tRNA synthetase